MRFPPVPLLWRLRQSPITSRLPRTTLPAFTGASPSHRVPLTLTGQVRHMINTESQGEKKEADKDMIDSSSDLDPVIIASRERLQQQQRQQQEQQRLKSLEDALFSAQNELSVQEANLKSLQKNLSLARDKVQRIESLLEDKDVEASALENKIADINGKIHTAEQALSKIQPPLPSRPTNAKSEEKAPVADDHRQQLKSLREERSRTVDDHTALRGDIEALQRSLREAQKEVDKLEAGELVFKSLVDDVQSRVRDAQMEFSNVLDVKSERAPIANSGTKTGVVKDGNFAEAIIQSYGDGRKGTALALFLQWAFQTPTQGMFSDTWDVLGFLILVYIAAMFVFFFSDHEFANRIPFVPLWLQDQKEDRISLVHKRVLRRVFDKKRTYLQIGDYIERPDMEREIKEAVSKSTDSSYSLITGAHGIGLSTTARKVVHDLVREGFPIIYLSMEGESPIEELARELGTPVLRGETSDAYISRVLGVGVIPPILDEICQKSKAQGLPSRYPLTIVVDNVNNLLDRDEEMLRRFQQMIKGKCIAAENRVINIIFVSSDGLAPKYLWSKSESSRMFEIRLMEATGEVAKDLLKRLLRLERISISDHALDKATRVIGGAPTGHLLSHNSFKKEVKSHLQRKGQSMENDGWVSLDDQAVDEILDEIISTGVRTTKNRVASVFHDSVSNKALRKLVRRIIEHEDQVQDPNVELPFEEAVEIIKDAEAVREDIDIPYDVDVRYRATLLLQVLGEHNILEIVPSLKAPNRGVLLQQRSLRAVWERILEEQERRKHEEQEQERQKWWWEKKR